MSITTTTTKITPQYLRGKTKDELIHICLMFVDANVRSEAESDGLRRVLDEIDQTLRVPAAEYVPAISDVFTIIDRVKCGAVKP